MDSLDIKKILEEFSDKPITYENKSENLNFTTYMLSKASSNFFVRVFNGIDDALPSISIQTYLSDLPSNINDNEKVLAATCNQVNYHMDNGTTTSYFKTPKNIYFLVIKLGIPFINDVIKNISDVNKSEHMLKMFLYTAFIEITKTKGYLSDVILKRSADYENS